MSVTRDDLAESVSRITGFPKKRCKGLFDRTLELMRSTMASREDVLISGFGKFEVRDKRSKKGRNPQTGGELTLEARRVVAFKPSGVLKDKMNGQG